MNLSKLFTTNLFQQSKAVPTLQPAPPKDTTNEMSHITQEMYKKNFELAEKNKTLSILRRIDEIILGSVTDPKEIAHAVTKMLVAEGDFKMAAIYVIYGKILRKLSLYETEGSFNLRTDTHKKIYEMTDIPLDFDQNLLIKAVKDKSIKVTGNLYDILVRDNGITEAEALEIQRSAGVNTTFIYPLITRKNAIGAMSISLTIKSDDLSDYQKDLLSRLYDIIGIAIDNALLYNQVQESNEKLKALDKLKDEFVSLASHELRTPMTAIKSYLWMVLNGKGGEISEKQKHYLDVAYSSTERLIALVNDMLNVSRIESGRITLEKKPGSIEDVAKAVIDEILPRTQELGLTLSITPHEKLPNTFIDSNKMKEVLINLIGNSLKFTPSGGKITINFVVKDGMLQTEITDTGKGILPEDMSKLFQKFGLIAGSYTQNTVSQGTGLGLYITKSIIEMHNGKIWVTSEGRNKGSQFYFTLPVYMEPTTQLQEVVQPGEQAAYGAVPTSPNTVLPPAPNLQG